MHSDWTFDKFQVFEMSLTETDTVISHSSNCSLLLLPLEAAEGSKLALGCLPQHNLFPFALPFWAEAAQPRASHSLGTAKPGFPRSAGKSRAGLGAGGRCCWWFQQCQPEPSHQLGCTSESQERSHGQAESPFSGSSNKANLSGKKRLHDPISAKQFTSLFHTLSVTLCMLLLCLAIKIELAPSACSINQKSVTLSCWRHAIEKKGTTGASRKSLLPSPYCGCREVHTV